MGYLFNLAQEHQEPQYLAALEKTSVTTMNGLSVRIYRSGFVV